MVLGETGGRVTEPNVDPECWGLSGADKLSMLCYSQIQHAAGEASGVSFVLALMQEPIAVPPPVAFFL